MSDPNVEPAFEFVAGDPSVDLVNTVDWTSRGPAHERLTSYRRLVQWAAGAGLVTADEAVVLLRHGAEEPDRADATLERALRLRTLLRGLFGSVARRERASDSWEELNSELADVLPRLRLEPQTTAAQGAPARWGWLGETLEPEVILCPILWSATELLRSGDAERLTVCDGPDCGWMFVDRSRNGLRRWCAMQTCGTRAKTRRRRRRRSGD